MLSVNHHWAQRKWENVSLPIVPSIEGATTTIRWVVKVVATGTMGMTTKLTNPKRKFNNYQEMSGCEMGSPTIPCIFLNFKIAKMTSRIGTFLAWVLLLVGVIFPWPLPLRFLFHFLFLCLFLIPVGSSTSSLVGADIGALHVNHLWIDQWRRLYTNWNKFIVWKEERKKI